MKPPNKKMRVLFLAGARRGKEISEALTKNSIQVKTIINTSILQKIKNREGLYAVGGKNTEKMLAADL